MRLPEQFTASKQQISDIINVRPEWVVLLSCIVLVNAVYRRWTRISIHKVRGPPSQSFILGNLPEIFQAQAGEADFRWQKEYGDVIRVKGTFGEDRLLIADPKALQYIFHTSGYNFCKWPQRTEISRLLMGRGLLWADGDVHKRQRKIMLPGFGTPESKAFIPIFQECGAKMSAHWHDILASSPNQTSVINVASWLAKTTMDGLGEAAFDYHFGALDSEDNELAENYKGIMSATLAMPSKMGIFLQTMLPVWVLQLLATYSNQRKYTHARHTAGIANRITGDLVKMKADALLDGKGSKDILSLLVKANASANASTKLTHEEMLAQMRTILLAGHETVATTVCWILLELANNLDVQQRLRDEIHRAEVELHARGGTDFTAADFDKMVYLDAVMKESMRYHPALYHNYRQAVRDDVLPLSKPITLADGSVVDELPVPKGTKVFLSIAGYHRCPEVFGVDADVFNPERWLRDGGIKKDVSLGVYGNLLTFSGGNRTCIGWRFALYEVQSLLVEMIGNFELRPTKELGRLRREACLVMSPTLEGEVDRGEQLPLLVSPVNRD